MRVCPVGVHIVINTFPTWIIFVIYEIGKFTLTGNKHNLTAFSGCTGLLQHDGRVCCDFVEAFRRVMYEIYH